MSLLVQLDREIESIKEKNPKLSDDNAFVYWFLSAYLLDSDDPELIKGCILGAKGDINIDAFHIDKENKKIFLIQTKYKDSGAIEKRNDIISFLDLEGQLYTMDRFKNLLTNANEKIRNALTDIYNKLNKQNYDLVFLYASTAKIAKDLKVEMINRPQSAHVLLFDTKALGGLFNDYLEGAAPPIPYIELSINDKQLIMNYNPDTNISNYLFFVKTSSIKEIFEKNGIKLFSRNIRGFLGETTINKKIQHTLKNEPEYFEYLNNGITLVCDSAKSYISGGQNVIRIDNPQIINGQQTTRCITDEPSDIATVLVRVVAIPKESEDDILSFSDMVNKIVASTNYQNAIKPSDLRCNDKEQIRIEKEFRKYGYHYVRKRMAKTEEKKYFSENFRFRVDRHNLVRAIAAVMYNPYRIRRGVEHLYEEDSTYQKIFSNRPGKEYLMFFWLHRLIQKESNAERSYSIWYVMNHIYNLTKDLLKNKQNRDAFIYICERQLRFEYNEILKPLRKIINRYFDIYVKDFFTFSKKESAEPLDMSSFFNNQALVLKFEKYFKKYVPKTKKEQLKKNAEKFRHLLEGFEFPE